MKNTFPTNVPVRFLKFEVNSSIFENREIAEFLWPFLSAHKEIPFYSPKLQQELALSEDELMHVIEYLVKESLVTAVVPTTTFSDWDSSKAEPIVPVPEVEGIADIESTNVPTTEPSKGHVVSFDID